MPEDEEVAARAAAEAVEAGTDQITVPQELLEEVEGETAVDPESSPRAKSLWAEIMAMGVAAKVKLALRGNKDARAILVRDPARQIRRFVLLNPRITDGEVISVARNRSADEELLRLIAGKRDWVRNYQVKLALVTNPKTPLPLALRQLQTLSERDLRQIAKSRNVSATIVGQARRMVHNLEQARGGSGH